MKIMSNVRHRRLSLFLVLEKSRQSVDIKPNEEFPSLTNTQEFGECFIASTNDKNDGLGNCCSAK